ncbi:MAG: hypothetical protein JW827_07190 [Spirochaetes bacterium]|nr:hypothetical protein [Spirochaetota bacterium]
MDKAIKYGIILFLGIIAFMACAKLDPTKLRDNPLDPLGTAYVAFWQWLFGASNNGAGKYVEQTSDGGFLVVGNSYFADTGSQNIRFIKTDRMGKRLFEKRFGHSTNMEARWMSQTSDGNYIIVGIISNAGNSDFNLLKIDSAGNIFWRNTFDIGGLEFPWGIVQASDGGYFIAASTSANEAYLIKADSSGNKLWHKMIFGGNAFASCVQKVNDGNYIVCGYGGNTDHAFVIKFDVNGNTIWSNVYDFDNDTDQGYFIQQTTDGGFIVTGTAKENSSSLWYVYLLKLDSSGNRIWHKGFKSPLTGNNVHIGKCVRQTHDGGYIIGGSVDLGAHKDAYLVKTDSSGNKEWEKTFGLTGDDIFNCIQVTGAGDYIAVGTYYNEWKDDIWLLKTN